MSFIRWCPSFVRFTDIFCHTVTSWLWEISSSHGSLDELLNSFPCKGCNASSECAVVINNCDIFILHGISVVWSTSVVVVRALEGWHLLCRPVGYLHNYRMHINDIGPCRMLSGMMVVLLEMSHIHVLLMYSIYCTVHRCIIYMSVSVVLTVFLKGIGWDRIGNKFLLTLHFTLNLWKDRYWWSLLQSRLRCSYSWAGTHHWVLG